MQATATNPSLPARPRFRGRGLGLAVLWLPLLVLAFAIAVTLSGCQRQAAPASSGASGRPPAQVSVAVAEKRDVPIYLDAIGKTVAREAVSVQPQVSGRITRLHFTDGADVKAGDLLFSIDPRPYQAQLDSALGTLAQKQAALAFARIELGRAAELIATKSISQEEHDTRSNAVAVAEAEVQQAEAAVKTARLNLEYCSIRSPIDGRAGQRLVDPGNVVTANSGSLLLVQRLDPIYADFTVTEGDLSAVQRNMARQALRAEVRLPDEPGRPLAGELTFLDNAVQDATGTVKLRATVHNRDRRLWPGRFVKVRLLLDTLPGAVLVPAAAPQLSAQGPFVYVVKPDSTAELRPVKTGQRQGDLVVIDRGVQPGEQVVVAGHIGVMPGGKVHVQEQARAAAIAPAGTAGAEVSKI
ncbi:MAG: efflux RND transporter periplasmic adaptor subunit [Acidobacteria bacterium]|nr:efflux RND transporter periplasmic adaptor subunit [Acidobacteriota bacterium]